MNNPNPVKIVETVLRDGHQSICATRMRTSDMLPVLEALDDCGFYALEAWGGATFDSCPSTNSPRRTGSSTTMCATAAGTTAR